MYEWALLHTDLQNDFFEAIPAIEFPGGALAVPGSSEIICKCNNLTWISVLKAGILRVFSRDWHLPNNPHFQKWPLHCVQNTFGAEFHGLIYVPDYSLVVSKGQGEKDGYSVFESGAELGVKINGRVLDNQHLPRISDPGLVCQHQLVELVLKSSDPKDLLEKAGIKKVLVDGLATNFCVMAGAIDAANSGFQTFLVQDTCRAVPDELKGDGPSENEAIKKMKHAGVIMTTVEEVVSGKLS